MNRPDRQPDRPRSPLRRVRPTASRWVGVGTAGGLVAGLGWFVGLPAGRTALAVLAVAVLVLVARTDEPVEGRWPEPPSMPTRPGWHGVAATQRLLEAAGTDAGDRATLRLRLDRLPPEDPRTGAVRRVAGINGPRTTTPHEQERRASRSTA